MPDTAALHRDKLDTTVKQDWERLRTLYHPDYTYMDGSGAEQDVDAAVAACAA